MSRNSYLTSRSIRYETILHGQRHHFLHHIKGLQREMLCPSSPPRARTVHLRVQIKLRKHQLQSLPADLRMEQSARFRQSAAQIHVAIVAPRDYSSLLLRAAYDTTDTPRLATHGNLYATADSHYAPSPRLVALTAPHRSSSRLRTDTCSRSSCRPNARARRPSGSPSIL